MKEKVFKRLEEWAARCRTCGTMRVVAHDPQCAGHVAFCPHCGSEQPFELEFPSEGQSMSAEIPPLPEEKLPVPDRSATRFLLQALQEEPEGSPVWKALRKLLGKKS